MTRGFGPGYGDRGENCWRLCRAGLYAQDVVGAFGLLNAGEMMDGLGLAETTPGLLTLWQPELATFDWRVAVLAALSGLLLLKLHRGIGWVLAICAGLAWLMVNGL